MPYKKHQIRPPSQHQFHGVIENLPSNDEVHLRLVAVMLRQSRVATQEEICQAFGHGISTQARWERQYAKHGIDGLISKKPTGRGRDLGKSQEDFVRRWFQAGYSNREIAKRLGVDETTIRRTLKRLGLTRQPVASPVLPGIEDETADADTNAATTSTAASENGHDAAVPAALPVEDASPQPQESNEREVTASEEPPAIVSFTVDHDPRDHSGDRSLARAGLLDDAVPLFANAECVPRAGCCWPCHYWSVTG